MDPQATHDPRDRDDKLVRAARDAPEGDLRAFEELVQLYRRRILANCRYLTRDENNSEDLAQEVFVKAFFGLRGFEGRSSFRNWLQRIKVNHCLNHLKKQAVKKDLAIDEEAIEGIEQLRVPASADREIAAMENRRRIEDILNSMPATLRIPLILCDMDELPYEEIAIELGIGLSAVKMRIKRAREYFRNLYEHEEDVAEARAGS
ncbi:MAG: RNA polymerase sigma factor [Bryobacteraceae bacterium]